MKKTIYLLLFALCVVFAACLKDKAGSETLCFGTAVDQSTGQAAAGVKVTATDGNRRGNTVRTAADGAFSIVVTAQQLHDGYYLLFTADSLYKNATVPLTGIGYGLEKHNMQTVFLEGAELPQLTTAAVSGLTTVSAVCGGNITDNGRSAIRRRGVCWSPSQNPTVVNNHSEAGSGSGNFAVSITGLQPGTTYYARAYAVNAAGTAYGQEVRFATPDGTPSVTTGTVTKVTSNTIYCGGSITSDNGKAVTKRGICYSATASTPTLHDNATDDGTGIGDFTSHITGLQSGVTYYIRAYATNAVGTGYGEVKVVTTL